MTEAALRAGAKLGRFRIVGPLGAGGMGEVYRAHDATLGRDVAIKVLPRQTLDDPSARARLLREARSAAALNHPNVCTVFEVGEDRGHDFIAMELVVGRSLDHLRRSSGLGVAEVVRLGSEIADALAHAHERGVVHRDLKTANVMLTADGRVKVMDFGLARLAVTADSSTVAQKEATLTEPGAVVGTTHYLPPEALHGGTVDARGDCWALGVMLHELVSGQMPFDGQTRFEVAAAIMHSAPRELSETVPAGLRVVIARCLEKEPGRRYQHAGEIRAALEAVAMFATPQPTPRSEVASPVSPASRAERRESRPRSSRATFVPGRRGRLALLGAIVLIIVILAWPRIPRPGVMSQIRSLAVLPIVNLSRDPEQEYFAVGMTEEIVTRLAQIAALRVISQGSVAELVQKRRSLSDIGRLLRVPVLLRGSVARDADSVRISVQLVDAASGDLRWAESYTRRLVDILALQGDVALAIAHAIHVQLTPQERKRLANSNPIDPAAYEAYLKGRAAWAKYTLEGFQESERQFRRAIEISPTHAPAWAGLADAAYGMSSIFVPPNTAIPKARAAAARALELDPTLAEAHTSAGIVSMVYDWDWRGAEQAFDRAIALRPGDANAHLWRGHMLVMEGRFDDGMAAIRRALDLDPLSPWITANVGWHLYFARRYDEAFRQLQAASSSDPGNYLLHVFLGLVLEQQGAHAAAIASLERAVSIETNNDNLAQLAHAYGTGGRRADAERVIAQLEQRREVGFVPAADIALAHAGLGERDAAFRWLELAIEDHSELLVLSKADPAWDPLRADHRFAAVLRRVNLAP